MQRYRVTQEEQDDITKRLAEVLAQDPSVVFAYLHGSFNEKDNFGDIDVAIFLKADSEVNFLRYEVRLEESLQKLFPFPVDVRVLNRAPLSFRYNVLKNGRKLVDKDESLRVEFEASTLSRYFDFYPFRRHYLKEVLDLEI
ncbi:MAG: type VII toxin-antitoxin system MntA family adenylyltransferase antitoxin [Bacillota bacterium]